MRLTNTLALGMLLIATSATSFADTIVSQSNPTAGLQAWNTSELTGSSVANRPYWDNLSWDGTYNQNVGGCLASSTNCGIANAPGSISYLGTSQGNAVNDFYFNHTGGSSDVTMQVQISANSADETFGWYDTANPANFQILFSGNTTPGAIVDFTPSQQYGFFFTDSAVNPSDIYTTQSDFQPTDKGKQHFAVFEQNASTFFLGMEDLPRPNSDFDYNDMIVKVSTTPEPASMALLGGGLLGIGVIGMRRRKLPVRSN